MATYIIGDLQGCFDELILLLKQINFKIGTDHIWFCGDLVNRGPKSLETIEFVMSLPNCIAVLGNHDLHLLALSVGHPHTEHSLHDILTSPKQEKIINWLRLRPLVHFDHVRQIILAHAGVYPGWSIAQAENCAREAERALQSDNFTQLIHHLYGDSPSVWSDQLSGIERLRFIVNAFTRMRICDAKGFLKLDFDADVAAIPQNFKPWFDFFIEKHPNWRVAFGHWAAILGESHQDKIFALDTGCVYGNRLTALHLESGEKIAVKALKKYA